MKILFTLDSLANAGTEKSTLDNLSHFSKQTEVKVIHFFPAFDLQSSYENARIPHEYVNIRGKLALLKGVINLVKIIKKEKPDLIVSSILRANLISRFAGLITGTRVVGTFVNDSYGEIRIAEMRAKKKYTGFRAYWLLDKFTAGIPKFWISNAISIAKSNAAALSIKPGRIKVIYRGRNFKQFIPWVPRDNKSTFKFVFVGRLLERKGIRELLQAFKLVTKMHEHIQLDFFGDGLFRKKAEEIVSELELFDSVKFHGKVDDGWKQLYNADAFVFPSWYEGFSGSLVEAMMTGIPIIASGITMNLEAVNSDTALIYPVKDVTELANRMHKMIECYPEMINKGRRAREVAEQRFNITGIAGEYEEFLRDVVKSNGRNAQLI